MRFCIRFIVDCLQININQTRFIRMSNIHETYYATDSSRPYYLILHILFVLFITYYILYKLFYRGWTTNYGCVIFIFGNGQWYYIFIQKNLFD